MDEQVYSQLPTKLKAFMDTLTEDELSQLSKIDSSLVAKIYQAGAVFSLEVLEEQ